jgi:ketosteroid isomerase-like protein
MVTRLRGLFVLLLLAPLAFAADAPGDLAAQVRAREIAFAKTLADRDAEAFAAMIAPDVIWLADKPLHGPDEVLANWRKFFAGPEAPFSWAPDLVEVQPGGALALSTGPVFDPAGKRIGTFTSIWRREANGEWKIIFDRGCPVCDCAGAPAKKEG